MIHFHSFLYSYSHITKFWEWLTILVESHRPITDRINGHFENVTIHQLPAIVTLEVCSNWYSTKFEIQSWADDGPMKVLTTYHLSFHLKIEMGPSLLKVETLCWPVYVKNSQNDTKMTWSEWQREDGLVIQGAGSLSTALKRCLSSR